MVYIYIYMVSIKGVGFVGKESGGGRKVRIQPALVDCLLIGLSGLLVLPLNVEERNLHRLWTILKIERRRLIYIRIVY